MKISARSTDFDYNPEAKYYRAYLDGELVNEAFFADDVAGIVRKYKLDENGKLILNETKTDVLWEELTGKVEIRRID